MAGKTLIFAIREASLLIGENWMLQKKEETLQLKVIDFGKAERIKSEDLKESGGNPYQVYDISEVVRLFKGLYQIEAVPIPTEHLKELYHLVDAATSVAYLGEKMDATIQDIKSRIGGENEVAMMMKKVAAILFSKKDYISLHGDELGDEVDGDMGVGDEGVDLEEKAARIPDSFMESLKMEITLRKQK